MLSGLVWGGIAAIIGLVVWGIQRVFQGKPTGPDPTPLPRPTSLRGWLARSDSFTELLAVLIFAAVTMAVMGLGGLSLSLDVPGPWWLGPVLMCVPGVALGGWFYLWIKHAA